MTLLDAVICSHQRVFQAKWIHSPLGALQAKEESKPPIICHVIELLFRSMSIILISITNSVTSFSIKSTPSAEIWRHGHVDWCVTEKRENTTIEPPPTQISKSVLYNIDWIIQYVYAALLATASSAALTQNNTFCDINAIFTSFMSGDFTFTSTSSGFQPRINKADVTPALSLTTEALSTF